MAESPPAAPPPLGPPDPRPGRATWALLAALVLLFAAWIRPMGAALDPTARDQVHDLSLAIRIREGTALSDDNRHPLFPALLAPVARREPRFFEDAWWISVAVSALSLAAVGAAATRVFGAAVGIATTVVFAFELRLQARRICPEPLVAACLALAAAALARAPLASRPRRGWLLAGAWTGAAWLTKGSALLSLGAAAISALLVGGRRGPLARLGRAAAVLLAFVAVAWPLLAWNLSRGHGPTYNVNSAHVMWEDAWDEGLDRRSTATPEGWFAAHGARDALRRLGDGLVEQRGVEWVYLFLGATAVAAVVGRRGRSGGGTGAADAAFDPRGAWRRHALSTAALWLPAFAWYAPIVASRRLLFPCFAVLMPPTLEAVGRIGTGLLPGPASKVRSAVERARPRLLPVGAALVLAAAVALALVPPARPFRGVDPVAAEVARDLRTLVPRRSTVLVRPSRTAPPDWLVDDHVDYGVVPSRDPMDTELAWGWLSAYLLVSEGLVRNRPAELAEFARLDEARGLLLPALPPAGTVLLRAWPAAGRTRFALYRLHGSADPK